jgi:2-polyprenyl-3-methyl-5-hydroxy-6-metoxy-1,4-benzoquinol methylase
MKQWYEELFEDFSDQYDKESFTKGTAGEVDFIEQEINFNKNARILDIGCGTGRHAIELAQHGYKMTGIDLSESMLTKAKIRAKSLGLDVEFILNDARTISFASSFEVVIMICEGAFPLMETDEMNFIILKNAYNALTNNGKLILTTLNGLFPLFHSVKDFINDHPNEGKYEAMTFDLMTFREHSSYETTDDKGNHKLLYCNERYYVPSEITWILKSLGFTKVEIFGCKLGAFSRNDRLTTGDYEMLVIADK